MFVKDILIKTDRIIKKLKNFHIYSKGAAKIVASNLLKMKQIRVQKNSFSFYNFLKIDILIYWLKTNLIYR